MTLAELRRKLPVGKEFTGEFIGKNRLVCKPGAEVARRRVIKQTSYDMTTEILDGPNAGRQGILGGWKNIKAREEDGAIILTSDGDFLKITL